MDFAPFAQSLRGGGGATRSLWLRGDAFASSRRAASPDEKVAYDPSRRAGLPPRRPLGRSDRARHAAGSAVARGESEYGDRTVIKFRDRPISFKGLDASRRSPPPRSCARASAGTLRSRCSSATRPTIPSTSSARSRQARAWCHLSPLDGEIALSHKLADSGARVLVTSNLSALLPTALKFLEKGLLDRLIVCEDDHWGSDRHAADAAAGPSRGDHPQALRRRCDEARAMASDRRPRTSRCCNIPAAPPACRRARC